MICIVNCANCNRKFKSKYDGDDMCDFCMKKAKTILNIGKIILDNQAYIENLKIYVSIWNDKKIFNFINDFIPLPKNITTLKDLKNEIKTLEIETNMLIKEYKNLHDKFKNNKIN